MFSEIASSHVAYFWFITCSVSFPVVLLLASYSCYYVFVVVLFHGIKPAQHHIFRMIICVTNWGKCRPRHWGKAGLGDRLDRRRLIRLLKEQTQSSDGI